MMLVLLVVFLMSAFYAYHYQLIGWHKVLAYTGVLVLAILLHRSVTVGLGVYDTLTFNLPYVWLMGLGMGANIALDDTGGRER